MTSDPFARLFEENAKIDFKDFKPGQKYVFVIVEAKKQMARHYDEKLLSLKGTNKKNWYVPLVGYFTKTSDFCHFDTDLPFYVQEGRKCTVSFSGYGFYNQFRDCGDKVLEGLTDGDAIQITLLRQRELNNKKKLGRWWRMISAHIIKRDDLIETAKQWEVVYHD
jgi:hypothetical protein